MQDDETGYAVLALPDGKILIAGGTGTSGGLRHDIALVRLLGDSDQDAIAVNEAPVNVVPGAQTSRVNHALSFNAYQGNQISISDADAGPHHVQVTLTATHGTISLIDSDPNGGLNYTVGDGTEDTTMTFDGQVSDINTALSWLVFHPEADYVGSEASLTITTNDQGYLGSGGPQEDSDSVAIELTAVPAFADSPSHATIPAALDTSFGTDGMEVLSVSEGIDYIRSLKLLASGKILAVGAVNNHFGLLRFNSDLSLDTSFGTDGVVETSVGSGNWHAADVIEHPEGGLLVAGKYGNLVRYTDDGALDTSFGSGGIANGGNIDSSFF